MSIVATAVGTYQSFPYEPEVPIKETLEWLTEVQEAYDGTEYREQLRTKPRHKISYTIPLSAWEIGFGMNALASTYTWALPLWAEKRETTDVFDFGTYDVVTVDTSDCDYRIGFLAMLWNSESEWELRRIRDVTASAIEVDDSNAIAGWQVIPCVEAKLVGRKKSTNGYEETITLDFEVIDVLDLTGPAGQQFLSDDAYTEAPYNIGEITKVMDVEVKRFDQSTGPIEYRYPWTDGKYRSTWRNVLDGLAEVRDFKEFLYRRAGRYRPIWIPTHEQNIRVVDHAASTTITIEDDNYDEVWDTIAIQTVDGNWHFRQLASPTPVPVDRYQFTIASLPDPLEDFRKTNFVHLGRLNSDSVTLTWVGNRVAEVELGFMGQVPLQKPDEAVASTTPIVAFDHRTPKWQEIARSNLATSHGDDVQSILNAGSLGGYIEFDAGVAPTIDTSTMSRISLKFAAAGRLTFPDAPELSMVVNQGFEIFISLWSDDVATTALPKGPLGKWDGAIASDQEWFLSNITDNTPEEVGFQIHRGGSAVIVEGDATETVNDSADHVINARVSTDNVLYMYLDGVEVASGPADVTAYPAAGNADLAIGIIDYAEAIPTGNSRFLGNIKALRIYNQELTSAERAATLLLMQD